MPPPAYRLTPVKGLSPKAAWYRISDSSNASGHNPLHNQLSAIFNHAVRYYELRSNPAAKVRNMGSEEHREMLFWTKEEYKKFSFEMMDKDVITTPKTKKSNRTIKMPHFLCEEMQEYLGMLYGLKKKDRIFTVTKSYLHHEMDRGAKVAGVKRIRIHDLRHPYVKPTTKKFASFLKFFRAAAIAARSCSIRYSWLMLPFQISPFLKSPA